MLNASSLFPQKKASHASPFSSPPFVLFTDLDGTLLEHRTYSFEPARPALEQLRTRGIPLVICTSKTRAEVEVLQEAMGIQGPFIVENGGAIYIPQGFFSFPVPEAQQQGPYLGISLGTPYSRLREVLVWIRDQIGGGLQGFGDLSLEELAARTQVARPDLARLREYDEPFFLEDPAKAAQVEALAREKGLQVTRGGRFYHLIGNADKGKAVRILQDWFRHQWPGIWFVAVGDSANDRPMLEAVALPALVQKPSGGYEPLDLPGLLRVPGIGPEGWRRFVEGLLEKGESLSQDHFHGG